MKKGTLWLIVVLAVLLIIYFVGKGFNPKLERAEKTEFAKFDTLGVTKIVIDAPEQDKDVTFEKIEDRWYLKEPISYLADKKSIDRLLKTANDFSFEGIISENTEKQSKFQVDSTGTSVKFYKGSNLALDFIIGKTDQSYSHTFLRETGSNKVLSAFGNISSTFKKKVDQWRNRVIVNLPKDEIDLITVSYANTKISFTHADTMWFVAQNGKQIEVKPAKISPILSALSPLKNSKFQDDPINLNWKKPDQSIEVTLVDGSKYKIKFIKKDDKEVYIKATGNDNIFIASSYTMKRFQKKLEDFQKKVENKGDKLKKIN